MATTVKTKPNGAGKNRKETAASAPEPKRLSKAGQWKRDNPGGFFKVLDWRAVNK
jgi:hypothetical protein